MLHEYMIRHKYVLHITVSPNFRNCLAYSSGSIYHGHLQFCISIRHKCVSPIIINFPVSKSVHYSVCSSIHHTHLQFLHEYSIRHKYVSHITSTPQSISQSVNQSFRSSKIALPITLDVFIIKTCNFA